MPSAMQFILNKIRDPLRKEFHNQPLVILSTTIKAYQSFSEFIQLFAITSSAIVYSFNECARLDHDRRAFK
jgi:hypothetical protein